VDVTVENCLDASDGGRSDLRRRHRHRRHPRVSAGECESQVPGALAQGVAVGALQESAAIEDMAPFVAARAVPPYLSTVASPSPSLKTAGVSGTGFDILDFGDLTVPMNAHSGRRSSRPYPDWTAQFLVHKTPAQRAVCDAPRRARRSWGIHVRSADGSMPSIDAPGNGYYWLDPRWKDPGNMSAGFTGPRGHLEHRAEPGDIAHQPSLAFVPYLITGDRFFADEMAYWRTSASSARLPPTTIGKDRRVCWLGTRSAASDGACATSGMRRPTCPTAVP